MRMNPIINSFSSGELSPRLMGRTDSPKYLSGCETMENFMALPHGGAKRRGGTQFINEVKNSAHTTRLIPFEFSVDQTYVLEFGNNYIRFYTNGGQIQANGSAYEITTTYTHSQVNELQFAQNADVMWIVHPSHKPRKLTRLAHASWTIADEIFKKGPFLPVNQNESLTLTFASTSAATQNITASASLFNSSHVGADFLIDTIPNVVTGEVVWVRVNSVASATVANVTIKDLTYMPQDTNPTNLWQEAAFTSTKGFPSAVVFYEQRLWYAGTVAKPQTFWASKTGEYENFELGANANDSLSYAIASDRVNNIKWLAAQRVLIIGTSGGEFRVTGGNESAVTPTNIDVRRQTSYGSKLGHPAYVGSDVFFIQRSGTQVRNVAYKWESDSFQSDDITFLAEHITEGGLTTLSYSHVPDSLLLGLRSDGVLIMLTYDPSQEVVGWHRHTTDGEYKSLAVISEDGPDQYWFVVKRTINGAVKQFIERYTPNVFMDSMISYSGSSTSSVTGLSHLEGKTVQIVADGSVHPDLVVSSGALTLNYAATDIKVGLKYVSKLTPTRPGANVGNGTTLGKMKRWNEIFVRLDRSSIPKINGQRPSVRSPGTNFGNEEPTSTEDIDIKNLGYDRDGRIIIEQDLPLPCHIVSIFGTLSVGD
tara:strand:+ start:470 stop:2419 length:1950 start_codon:yes stop_codon:yes gene_type:complete